MKRRIIKLTRKNNFAGERLSYELWTDDQCASGLVREEKISRLIEQINPLLTYLEEELIYQSFLTRPNVH